MSFHVTRCALLLVVLLMAGCGGGGGSAAPADLIVGKWKHAGNVNERIEFAKDGAITVSDGTGALPPLRGRYALTGDQLELTLTDNPGKQTDEGTKYFAASWMEFEHMNAMMDRKEVKVRATATVTAEKLSMKVGETVAEYSREK